MEMSDLIESAKQFCIDAHNSVNHRRKYTDEPYHVHPARVALLIASVTSDAEVIAAAWLHDVLEDVAPKNPEFGEDSMRAKLGDRVTRLVLEVTDVSRPTDGNRAVRKAIDRAHLAIASDNGKTIKLADLIDNILDISKHDPNFARVFKREALLDLPFLKSGDERLYRKVSELLV